MNSPIILLLIVIKHIVVGYEPHSNIGLNRLRHHKSKQNIERINERYHVHIVRKRTISEQFRIVKDQNAQ